MQLVPDHNLNFFFSGTMGRSGWEEERLAENMQCRLCSCHGNYIKHAQSWAKLASRPDNQIRYFMMDSGGFTAWKSGHSVHVSDLIASYHSVLDLLDTSKVKPFLINLDTIPGKFGEVATKEQVSQAIAESDKNFEILTNEFGNIVLPVFHQGESEARLKEVLAQSKYICASPQNGLAEWTRVKWSEEVHKKISRDWRTHGLATTGATMMSRVPWWSVDSAAFLFSGAMGKVDVLKDGNWVSINISVESPDRYNEGKHYDNASQALRDVIDERAAYHGLDVQKLRTDHMSRKLLNGLEIQEWLKTFKFVEPDFQPSLFDL